MVDCIYHDGRYYDGLFSELSERDDLHFWIEQAKRWCDPVLELGCGTGRLAIPIKYNGFAVDFKYGDFDGTPFDADSEKQLSVSSVA